MPEISVIVPVYNTEKYLDRCIRSIIDQTFSDFELILVDDGSKDNSGFICDEWEKKDSRIKVIHQKNAGAGAARNAGLSVAEGKYIGFIDSDDWIEPEMYQVLYNAMVEHSVQVAMCDMRVRKDDREKIPLRSKGLKPEIKNQLYMFEQFFRVHGNNSMINVCIKLIDRNILSGFKFLEGTISEDVMASYYFIKKSETTAVINVPLYNYFINKSGVTKSPVTQKDFEYIDSFYNIWKDIEKNYPSIGHYAYLNFIRSNFTILTKMKLFGYDKTDFLLNKRYENLKKIVRNNFWNLLKWKMPISRKLLLCYVCI